MIKKNFYAVIMAGGGGTRLWPLSRIKRPKQMLRLFDERSLFQTAVNRLEGIFSPDQIFVATVKAQVNELRRQCPDIPVENFLIEPQPRGTASVVGLAAVALQKRTPEAIMAVLTSDHFIGNEALFQELLMSAFEVAQEGYLVTLGINPTYAATGFGYIQVGESIGSFGANEAFLVKRFTEKPSDRKARSMVELGDHVWNSGMFVFSVKEILREFNRQMPGLAGGLNQIANKWVTNKKRKTIENVWYDLQPQSIDYGIMESAEKLAVISAAGLEWSDVGSWDALFDVLDTDENGNILMGGEHFSLDTHDSLIYSQKENRLVVTVGIDDMILVDTGDVLMICHKNHAQKVRQVVQQLKEKGNLNLV